MMPPINWDIAPDPQEIANLRDSARLPMWEKIAWLEEMQRMVEFMNDQRRQKEQTDSSVKPIA